MSAVYGPNLPGQQPVASRSWNIARTPQPTDIYAGVSRAVSEMVVCGTSPMRSAKLGAINALVAYLARMTNEGILDAQNTYNFSSYVNLEYVVALILGGVAHKIEYRKANMKVMFYEGLNTAFNTYIGDIFGRANPVLNPAWNRAP
jgi:hypothetical protein